MRRRTKIVCTLGPAVDSRDKIRQLIEAGMNVARLNCSHGNWEEKKRWIEWVRELSPKVSPVAILVDLQGPKFRVGDLAGGALDLEQGMVVSLGPGGTADIPIDQPEILGALGPGGRLVLGDGEIELRVIEQQGGKFLAKVVIGGMLMSRKGVTLIGKLFDAPALTDKDREDTIEAAKCGADFIALSYVKSANDIRELRRVVDSLDKRIRLCAKIEMREGIRDLENILKVSDLVMVARGDMGLQMEIEDVPIMQKRIIHECSMAGTPVITATQMLESMIHNPRPTRAEATDVANAILDGTDAVMLSGETAQGQYPFACVKTMARIAEKAESVYDRSRIEDGFQAQLRGGVNHTDAIAHAVCDLAHCLRSGAIVTTSTSGQTPRLVSKFRPRQPILCATWDDVTLRQLAVVWGVEAVKISLIESTDDIIRNAIDAFFAQKRLKLGELVIITAGIPAGSPGNTNMIVTQVVK
jgi:pyruvate kinase